MEHSHARCDPTHPSADTAARSDHGRFISRDVRERRARQALPQPRRGPAAHHPRRAVGRRVGRIPAWCGRAPTGPRACWSRSRPPTASATSATRVFVDALPETRFHRQGAARGPAGRAGHLLSHRFAGSRVADDPRRAAGRPLPHRAERPPLGLVRVVGRHRRPGLGHRRGARRHAHLRDDAATTARTSSSTPATTSMPTARSRRELKLPNGESLAQHRHRGEVQGRRNARRVPRQLQIQSARRATCARSTPRCRCSRNGTTTRSPTTGARASRSRRTPTPRRASWLLAARGSRAFREYMPMRETPAEAGRVYRKIAYGPLLDVFMLDMRSLSRHRTARTATMPPDSSAPAQLAWLKRELMNSQATWKVIAADMPIGADQRRTRSRRATARRAAASSRSRTSVLHQARRRPQHGLAHRRHALHRRALLRSQHGACSRISSRSGSSCRARSTPAPGVRASSTTRSARAPSTEGLQHGAGRRISRRASDCSSSAMSPSTAQPK